MINLLKEGKIDRNDLQHIERLGYKPSVAIPAPMKGEKISPHVSRFVVGGNKAIDVFHVKPIYYYSVEGTWRPLYEIASYYGNTRGMVLREGWEQKMDMRYLVWYIKRLEVLKSAYGVAVQYPSFKGMDIGPKHPLVLATTSTFHPDADTESTSVDGFAARVVSSESWSTIRGGNGTEGEDSKSLDWPAVTLTSASSVGYTTIRRSFFLFDTSAIGDDDTIDDATFSIYVTAKTNSWTSGVTSFSLVDSSPASNTAIASSDYQGALATLQASAKSISGVTTSAYNDFTLNATGTGNVNKTGVSKFGLRIENDRADSEPTFSGGKTANINVAFADTSGTSTDPKLVVEHTASFNPAIARRRLLLR